MMMVTVVCGWLQFTGGGGGRGRWFMDFDIVGM